MTATFQQTETQWLQREVNDILSDKSITEYGAEQFLPYALSRPEPDESGMIPELCKWERQLLAIRLQKLNSLEFRAAQDR